MGKLTDVRSGTGLLIYGLEGSITARRGISSRINQAIRNVDGLQQRLTSLYACMWEAMDRYQQMEDGLAGKARDLGERRSLPSSYPDIPGLDWSKVPDNMKQQLLDSIANAEQQKYKIPGLDWDKVPANLRDSLRASIDQAAQQRAYRTEEESTALAERDPAEFKAMVGGYEREHPGSNEVYYIDGHGQRTLIDFDKLQELVAAYNRQGGNYLPGDILLMMPVDYTPFFLYALQRGYDPRTFQPLDPQNLEAMTGYVIGRKVVEEESREKARAWESLALDLMPIVGLIKAVIDLSTGQDSVTGRELDGWDYGVAGAATIAPGVAKPIAKGLSKGAKAVFGAEEAVRDGARVVEGVGKAGEGIPLEEVKQHVLEQIYRDGNGVYGYLPKEGTPYAKYDFTDVEKVMKNRAIREEYLEQSMKIQDEIDRMTHQGIQIDEIADKVVHMRNQDKVAARAKMSPEELAPIEQRNMALYGNSVGPDAQWLFNDKKKKLLRAGLNPTDQEIWQSIIQSSMKKDDVLNTLLGLRH